MLNRPLFSAVATVISALIVFFFTAVMLNTILQYDGERLDVGFLRFKKEVVNNRFWRFFFYVHIASILVCLFVGGLQFTQLVKKTSALHRIFGRIYGYTVLLINVPACFVLGVFSNGGILGISGFLIQNVLWAISTYMGVMFALRKNRAYHQIMMIYSYAITTTALTFRILKNAIYSDEYFDYTLFYGANVWAALVINLGIAQLIIGRLSFHGHFILKNHDGEKEEKEATSYE